MNTASTEERMTKPKYAMRIAYLQYRVSIAAWEFPCNQMYAYLNIIYRCKVNAFLPHKRRICIIFAVYDADFDKMMQIKCLSNDTPP